MMDSFGHKNIFISRLASVKIWLDWKLEVDLTLNIWRKKTVPGLLVDLSFCRPTLQIQKLVSTGILLHENFISRILLLTGKKWFVGDLAR